MGIGGRNYSEIDAMETPSMRTKTVILGLGNTLLGDEGVGVRAARFLQAEYPELRSVEVLDGGTLSFTLAGPIEAADRLIVIDAAELHSAPGTIRSYESSDMDRFVICKKKSSVHEVSLADLLLIAHLTGHLPRHRALIGIQPGSIDWSDTLSEPVKQAIPVACEQALKLMARWRHDENGRHNL